MYTFYLTGKIFLLSNIDIITQNEVIFLTKIAIAQIEIRSGRPDLNTKKMRQFISEAKRQDANFIIFPGLSITGRMTGKKSDSFLKDCEMYKQEIVGASRNTIILFENEPNHCLIAKNGKLINPHLDFAAILSNSTFVFGEESIFKPATNMPTIFVNAIGLYDHGKTIYTLGGGSTVCNSRGRVVFKSPMFQESLDFIDFDEIDSMVTINERPDSKIEQIYQAIHYGVKAFLENIGMKKIVIGISGGIDSAVDAALYTKILGAENVLLVNMPSVYNSATTRNLSEQLAKNLGCHYMVVPIQESVDLTIKQLESIPMLFLGDGSARNINLSQFVRENIQARDRSSRILAALAAAFGGGFTCNANKAETTVGYATMYGDSAGVLSALADLWKCQVYALADYINARVYEREVIPKGIIEIVPSAELSTAQNVDEGKGDPLKYPYHDYLLRAFVERNVTPEDVLTWYMDKTLEQKIGCDIGLVKKYFTTDESFIADVERWWNLFKGIAVAKRLQAPPLIAITNHAFGSDYPESQTGAYYTQNYQSLKTKILQGK